MPLHILKGGIKMKVNVGGKFICQYENGIDVTPKQFDDVIVNDIDLKVDKIFKNQVIPISVLAGASTIPRLAYANSKDLADRLMPLIEMIQNLALPIGIGVATWGLVEIIVGNFGSGKGKIKYAVIGFTGMFIIPEIFYAIRDAFQGVS